MKKYFSKNEKFTLATLYGIMDYLHEVYTQHKKLKLPTRWLKSAHTFLTKAVTEHIEGASDDALLALYKYSRGLYITCLELDKVKRAKAEKKDSDAYVSLENERFIYLCSFAYGYCQTCTTLDHENCALKKIFLEYDIEPLKLEAEGCPYNHNDLQENAYYNLEKNEHGALFRVQPGIVLKGFKRVRSAPLHKADWEYPKISL